MFQNVLNHLPIVRHLVPICCYYRGSSDGDSSKGNYSKGEEGGKADTQRRCCKTLEWLKEDKFFILDSGTLSGNHGPLPQTSPSPKQLSRTPPEGTGILLWFQPSSHTSPLRDHRAGSFLQDHSPHPPCGSHSCQRDLPKHRSVMPQYMLVQTRHLQRFPKPPGSRSRGNTSA